MLRAASFRPGTSRRLYWNGRSDRGRLEDLSQSQQIGLRVFRQSLILKRRDVRVVEGARLESVCRGNSTEGSNPSLSANSESLKPWDSFMILHYQPSLPGLITRCSAMASSV